MPSFLIALSVVWALFYWIFGGVFFSIIALLRLGRIRRTRFGCLFSLSAIGLGVVAAWSGIRLAVPLTDACVPSEAAAWQRWIELFACGIVPILGAFLAGFVVLLVVGVVLLLVSRSTSSAWIEKTPTKEEKGEYEHQESHPRK